MNARARLSCLIALGVVLCMASAAAGADRPARVSPVDQPPVVRTIQAPQALALDQAPNQVNGLFSDVTCALCSTGIQVIADNFAVSTGGFGFSLQQVVLWGGFYPGDVPPAVDDFDVYVHPDAAGVPSSTVLCSQTGIAPTRLQTGVILFTVHEYQMTINLATACSLADGTYWIEVFTDTGAGDDWFWETGNLDAVHGIAGSVWTTASAPGSAWLSDGATNFAVQLVGTVLPVELQRFQAD